MSEVQGDQYVEVQAAESDNPGDGGEDSVLEEAIKAAEEAATEAGGLYGDDDDGEQPEAKAGAPTDKGEGEKSEAEPAAEDDDLASIEGALAKRRAEAKEKLRVREELAAERAELTSERQKLSAERNELNKAAELIRDFRKNPAKVLVQLGVDPNEFIDDLAALGTPQSKSASEMERLKAEVSELRRQRQEEQEAYERRREEYVRQQRQQELQQAESKFAEFATGDEYPALQKLFPPKRQWMLVKEASDLAEEYLEATGNILPWPQVAQYLNEEYSKDLGLTGSSRPGKPASGKTGALTLSSVGSERSPGLDPSEDDSDEVAQAKAIAAIRALRARA